MYILSIGLSMTPNMDCDTVAAVPKFQVYGSMFIHQGFGVQVKGVGFQGTLQGIAHGYLYPSFVQRGLEFSMSDSRLLLGKGLVETS